MTTKRTKSAAAISSPQRPQLRARKRQKVSASHSRAGSRTLNSDGDRDDVNDETDSDYEDGLSDDHRTRAARRRTSAPSAGAVTGSRTATARRTSLPHRTQVPARVRRTDGRARAGRRAGEDDGVGGITQQPRIPTRGASRTTHPLSPLPVNHAVERTSLDKGKGKERAWDDDGSDAPKADKRFRRQSREASATALSKSAVRMRRQSGSAQASPSSPEAEPRQRVLRRSRRRSSQPQIDYDEDQDDLPPRAGPSTAVLRNRRRTRSDSLNDLEPIDDVDEGAEPEAASSGETSMFCAAFRGSPWLRYGFLTDFASADLEAKLYTWSPDELRSLRAAELVDLVQRLYADVAGGPHPRTKDQSIQAILAARPPGTDSEASEQEDGRATPYPRTSHENSSEGGDSSTDSQRDVRADAACLAPAVAATPRRRLPLRRMGVRRQEPTPPPSASDDDGDAESGEGAGTEIEDDADQTPRATTSAATSTAMARRSSEVEMPPPPLPARRPTAHGPSPGLKVVNGPSALAGFHKTSGSAATALVPGATPVAHRTRGHVRPTKMAPPPPQGSAQGLKLQRTLFGQQSHEKPAHGSTPSGEDDAAMTHERDHVDDSGSESDGGSHGYNSGGESVSVNGHALRRRALTRRAQGTSAADGLLTGRRRSSRSVKQVITPPSDADEESGGETEHEDLGRKPRRGKANGAVEATSHQRQAGRAPRPEKVVRLSRVKQPDATMEDVDMQDSAHSDDDADEYEPGESEEHQGAPSLQPNPNDLETPLLTSLSLWQKTKST